MTSMTMVSSKIFLLLFIPFLFSPTTLAQQVSYLNHSCSTNKTFAENSTFQSDRTTLLSYFESAHTEFYNTTIASGSDAVYGLFMCQGGITIQLCHQCVVIAAQQLSSDCQFEKEAIIWYDKCMLRYSNRSFFSKVETSPRLGLLPTYDGYRQSFSKSLLETLNLTADEAANDAKKYATREEYIPEFGKMHSLLQCTPELSSQDCRKCLSAVIADLSSCCVGKEGGRILYPSCNVRYELYFFYNSDDHQEARGPIRIIVIVVVSSVCGLGMIFGLTYYLLKGPIKKRRNAVLRKKYFGNESNNLEPLQFSLATIETATHKFSHENYLGRGGFGQVYKGILSNGQEIAVKRLSKSSGQGGEQFKNEVLLIAKLQHRNLVALLGFCIEGQEKILIYEYVPNKSLHYILFGFQKGKVLNWRERCKIIGGVARGVLYLHEYSRLKIIHRDLKPSNILLDDEMNAKISDFGLAKMVAIDINEESTSRIVGTYGYMSPEYAMYGQYSEKSDVFSFGVIVLEIVSGKKNASHHSQSQSQYADGLLSYTWKQWKEEKLLEILDLNINGFGSYNEVIKCIQIGLLCVQENPDSRPTMAEVVSYLSNDSIQLPLPQEPAFLLHGGMGRITRGSNESASTIEMSVWKHWRDENLMEILDSNMTEAGSHSEIRKCIHIGFLFVQGSPQVGLPRIKLCNI